MIVIQIWGGLLYLLNKIFFLTSEIKIEKQKKWRVLSWIVYLGGLPAWIILFMSKDNWIAAAVELAGAPSMILGLLIAKQGKGREPQWLNLFALTMVSLGIVMSLIEYGGLTEFSQALEMGIVVGFLVGTYLLAREMALGYLFFALMNLSNAWLMFNQALTVLGWQQVASVIIVITAYIINKKPDFK